MTDLLTLKDVQGGYGAIPVLHGVSFSVPPAGAVAILGANGAGKTTTLRAICAMVKVTGEVTFDGHPLANMSTENIVRLGIAHVPDGRGTFSHLTVEENLRLGAYLRRDRQRVHDDFDRVYDYFPRLKERRRQQAGTLSGGEQQMLAISRALMLRPKLMLMDEPSFGLAPTIVQEIFGIFQTIRKDQSVGFLLVEQNTKLALNLVDHAYVLENGRVILSGTAAELRTNKAIRDSYLG